jgi:hypothetical protein
MEQTMAGVTQPQLTFRIPLRQTDWDSELMGWRCDATRIANVTKVVHDGIEYVPRVEGDLINWPGTQPAPAAVIAILEVSAPSKEPRLWTPFAKVLAALIPVVATAVTGYFSLKLEHVRAASQLDIARLEQATRTATTAKQTAETASNVCKKELSKIRYDVCVSNGNSSLSCEHSVFNIGPGGGQ